MSGRQTGPYQFLDGLADAPARHAVAARVEGRAGDDEVGRVTPDQVDDGGRGRILALAEEVVATVDGGDDLRPVAEGPLQRLARPHGAGAHVRRLAGLVLAPHTGEELVEVVDDSRLRHGPLLSRWGPEPGPGARLTSLRLRATLLVVQAATSVILLAGAALLVRSFVNLWHLDPGFSRDNVVAARITLSGPNEIRRVEFYDQVLQRI